MHITPHQAKYFAYELTRRISSENVEKLTSVLADARVDMNPHQVEAALFAFKSPLSNGAILAEEVGLGKTIEAGIVLSQFWAERKRRVLIILPSNLRKQWRQELDEKFFLPSVILESSSFNKAIKDGMQNPFIQNDVIVLCSYHFACAKEAYIKAVSWDVVVVDEAHRLRNVYKKTNKIANSIKSAIGKHKKILLTATPLQNSLLELYGLVSFIDDYTFGDRNSFNAKFSKITSKPQFADLKARLAPICKRTLRRQVLEYIKYTKRIAMTQKFEPTEKEIKLYDLVSDYLRRGNLQALPASQRSLMTLVLRKLLASSTFAIAGALDTLRKRLEKNLKEKQALLDRESGQGALEIESPDEDYEPFEATQDEWEEDEDEAPPTPENMEALRSEISDLKEFYDLAVSITENAKGEKLLSALKAGLEKTRELGGQEKAIIFTESKRTQNYVLDLLNRNGFKDQIVLFNGTNTDEVSKSIYREWLDMHQNTDAVSDSRTADMRSALVECFRDSAKVMIATEAAAEGINLQFCSLVINYDLPWNPQRIEQRIGRCHRYGQKNDVVVVNFLNVKNAADKRVYELLDEKFKLFDGVFGASDEVLGTIESGVDFEKRILKIYQDCRTPDEINKSFDQLQNDLESQIDEKIESARQQLLENFDEEVHEKLKICKSMSDTALNKYQGLLYEVTRFCLNGSASFDEEQKTFVLKEQPFQGHTFSLGPYSMAKTATDEHFYRVHHPLAEKILEKTKNIPLQETEITFRYKGVPKISILEPLIGKSGTISTSNLTVRSFEAEDHLICCGHTSDGKKLDDEQLKRLLTLDGIYSDRSGDNAANLDHEIEGQKGRILAKIETRNSVFFDEEVTKLEKWSEDVKQSLEIALKQLDIEIKTLKAEAKKIVPLEEKIKAQHDIKTLEQKRNNMRRTLFEEQDLVDKKKETLINEVSSRMKQEISMTPIFILKWKLVDCREAKQ